MEGFESYCNYIEGLRSVSSRFSLLEKLGIKSDQDISSYVNDGMNIVELAFSSPTDKISVEGGYTIRVGEEEQTLPISIEDVACILNFALVSYPFLSASAFISKHNFKKTTIYKEHHFQNIARIDIYQLYQALCELDSYALSSYIDSLGLPVIAKDVAIQAISNQDCSLFVETIKENQTYGEVTKNIECLLAELAFKKIESLSLKRNDFPIIDSCRKMIIAFWSQVEELARHNNLFSPGEHWANFMKSAYDFSDNPSISTARALLSNMIIQAEDAIEDYISDDKADYLAEEREILDEILDHPIRKYVNYDGDQVIIGQPTTIIEKEAILDGLVPEVYDYKVPTNLFKLRSHDSDDYFELKRSLRDTELFQKLLNVLAKENIFDYTSDNWKLFVYRLTGKNRPEGSLGKIRWTADVKVLYYLVRSAFDQPQKKYLKMKEYFDADFSSTIISFSTAADNASSDLRKTLNSLCPEVFKLK